MMAGIHHCQFFSVLKTWNAPIIRPLESSLQEDYSPPHPCFIQNV
jgi:hypothetical protein